MVVLGLDIATSTGACWADRSLPASAWRCLAIEAAGANAEEKDDDLAGALIDLLRDEPVDFAAIEMPQRSVKQFGKKPKEGEEGGEPKLTINPNALQLSGLAGAVVASLRVLDIPWGLIAPATWRSAYYGKGFMPPDGDWKAAAVRMAEIQQIALPPTAKARKDAAEAVGIATAWPRCTFVPTRHRNAFAQLLAARPSRPIMLEAV
jgi:hypothetical protein